MRESFGDASQHSQPLGLSLQPCYQRQHSPCPLLSLHSSCLPPFQSIYPHFCDSSVSPRPELSCTIPLRGEETFPRTACLLRRAPIFHGLSGRLREETKPTSTTTIIHSKEFLPPPSTHSIVPRTPTNSRCVQKSSKSSLTPYSSSFWHTSSPLQSDGLRHKMSFSVR